MIVAADVANVVDHVMETNVVTTTTTVVDVVAAVVDVEVAAKEATTNVKAVDVAVPTLLSLRTPPSHRWHKLIWSVYFN